MLTTRFTRLIGCDVPIQQAGMGGVGTAELASAVAMAGALGMIGGVRLGAKELGEQLDSLPQQVRSRIGLNFLIPFLDRESLEVAEVLQLCRSGRISWTDMVLAPSVAGLFKWRQFEPEVILLAVGWYLRFSLSYRDVEELLAERGLSVDHVTVWRWVQRYAPEIQRRLRPQLRPTNDRWRVDETYIRLKGKWVYLYRSVDSTGATIDFLLSAKRDAAAAERFLAKALGGENHPAPRVINTDKHAGYPPAVVQLKAEGALEENCRHRPVQYLNNVLEQDHRAIKRRIRASQHFRSFWGAWRTIVGYEAIHMIRKGQACRSAASAKVGLLHRFILGLFAAAI